jgi:alkanesulfonate monooxygenase SsuD/methylene tetrahydromethanopterin reductase-like flavin-dependent oxidoreductase (luciferase family)
MNPYQRPHPPIGVAATSRASSSIGVAGAKGWMPMSSSNLAPQYLGEHWTVVEETAAAAGKTADRRQWRIGRDVFVAQTPKETQARARSLAATTRSISGRTAWAPG